MSDRTITNLIPSIHAAVDVVSRELIGFIPAVDRDPDASRAAIGQTVYSPVVAAKSAVDVTAAVASPDAGDTNVGNVGVAITKSRGCPIRFTGEQTMALGQQNHQTIVANEIAQAMRTLVNEIETDLGASYIYASRAYGTAGTAPFGSTPKLGDAVGVKGLLDDNGAPAMGRSLIIGSAAEANLAALANLTQVGDAGSSDFLRRGVVGDIFGFGVRKSSKIATHTAGTGANATTNNAGYAVGATALTLASAGTGTLLAGDVVTFAGDTNKYVVTSGDTDVSDGGTLTIAAPGLLVAMSAATKAITRGAGYTANMAFSSNAIKLATRLPAMPEGGDAADDVYVVTDPLSGLSFEVAIYRQYRQVLLMVSIAWGVKVVKPEHLVLLLG
jgi:hypothetical protein